MGEQLDTYSEPCEIIREALAGSKNFLMCCDKPVEKLIAKTADQDKEKHVPIIENITGGIKVIIGRMFHPMEDKHYIKWIEVVAGRKAYRQFLKPGQSPEAVFNIDAAEVVAVREYCSVHGLWTDGN